LSILYLPLFCRCSLFELSTSILVRSLVCDEMHWNICRKHRKSAIVFKLLSLKLILNISPNPVFCEFCGCFPYYCALTWTVFNGQEIIEECCSFFVSLSSLRKGLAASENVFSLELYKLASHPFDQLRPKLPLNFDRSVIDRKSNKTSGKYIANLCSTKTTTKLINKSRRAIIVGNESSDVSFDVFIILFTSISF
jgi:hypothetical protein